MSTGVGLAAVESRIAEIRSRFLAPRTGRSDGDFAAVLGRVGAAGATAPTGRAAGSARGDQVVDVARQYLGVPYVYGSTDPSVGLDCSSLVQLVYRQVGVELPRVTYDQVTVGVPVDPADLRPGDLVFSVGDRGERVHGHVGIYVGDGKWIVAPKTGDVVSIRDLPDDITAIRRVLPPDPLPAGPPASLVTRQNPANLATIPSGGPA